MNAKNSDEIFLLAKGEVETLPTRPMREGLFGVTLEDAFQTLLEQYPEIIPGKQITPGADDAPRFVLIRREAPIGGWSLDHLLVDQYGILTLVECKLMQNSQSRREVVGQVIEYAANASVTWGGGQLRDFANNYWSDRGKDFGEVCRSVLGLEDEIDAFWDTVESNLQQGKIRLIIAGDEIRPEVRRMIEYLNDEMERVEVLGLELRCYGHGEERLVLVPTIVGQTVANLDKRNVSAKYTKWTAEAARTAFREWDDPENRALFAILLDWAEQNGRYMVSSGKHPGFGIKSPTNARLISISTYWGVWGAFDDHKFSDIDERDWFIAKLIDAELLDPSFDVSKEKNKKLKLRDGAAVEKLINILSTLFERNT